MQLNYLKAQPDQIKFIVSVNEIFERFIWTECIVFAFYDIL